MNIGPTHTHCTDYKFLPRLFHQLPLDTLCLRAFSPSSRNDYQLPAGIVQTLFPKWSNNNMKRVQSACNSVCVSVGPAVTMRCCTADENRERFPILVWIWREAAATAPNQECSVRDSVTDFTGVKVVDTTGMLTPPTTYFPPMPRDIRRSETTRWWNFLGWHSVYIFPRHALESIYFR